MRSRFVSPGIKGAMSVVRLQHPSWQMFRPSARRCSEPNRDDESQKYGDSARLPCPDSGRQHSRQTGTVERLRPMWGSKTTLLCPNGGDIKKRTRESPDLRETN